MLSLRPFLFVALLGLGSAVSFAPVARAESPMPADGTVVRIAIVGNRRIEADTVVTGMSLRRGDVLSASRVRRDLKALYGLGFFDDVRIDAVDEEGGFAITVTVDEKPAIRDVQFTGNKKVDKEDINKVIDIRDFAVLSDAAVKANVERIRDVYVEKGYYLVEIEPKIVPVGDDQVELTFDIRENKKVVIQRVNLIGADALGPSKVKRFMQTREAGLLPWLTSRGSFKKDALEADKYIIQQVYREEGYVDATVGEPSVYLSPDKRFVQVSFPITEGPKYQIGKVEVHGDFMPEVGLSEEAAQDILKGRTVYDIQEQQWEKATGKRAWHLFNRALAGVSIHPGETFQLSKVQAVMSSLSDFYTDRGYAFVNILPMPDTDPSRKIVDLTFMIDKGEQVRIGRINVTGNDPTRDKVVRREILVNEGDIYRGSLIKASRSELERLGFFSTVDISTPRGEGENVLDMNVDVTEQPTGTFSLGLGFSSVQSFMLTANVSKNNFLGLGYQMSAAVNWSALQRQANLSLYNPYFLDSRWTLQFSAYYTNQQFQLNTYQRGGTIGVGRYLDARDDVQMQVSYTFEDVGMTSLDAYRQRLMYGDLFRNGLTSSTSVSLTIDKRNNRMFATKGFLASASTSMAGGFRVSDDKVLSLLGGEFNYVDFKTNFRMYQPIFKNSDALVFRVNSSLSMIKSTDGRIVPFIQRYRAGGINSIRGYNWFSLGPALRTLTTEDPVHSDNAIQIGGTSSWINNIEIEGYIVRQAGILGVLFFDAGNAFGDPWGKGGIHPADLRMSYGAGVRWRSPMGPLRFELGFPVAPREGERKSVFDFSIGNFF